MLLMPDVAPMTFFFQEVGMPLFVGGLALAFLVSWLRVKRVRLDVRNSLVLLIGTGLLLLVLFHWSWLGQVSLSFFH